MALALSLVFDDETSALVRQMWQALADAGASRDMLELGYPPHLTLVVADDDTAEPDMRHALAAAARGPMAVGIDGVNRFAGTQVVWLGCDGGNALASLHAAIAGMQPLEAIRPHYRPGQWTPHMTLQTVGNTEATLAIASGAWKGPIVARAKRLELARFLPVQVPDGVALGRLAGGRAAGVFPAELCGEQCGTKRCHALVVRGSRRARTSP